MLALIGGRADMAVLIRHCTRYREEDAAFCGYAGLTGKIHGTMPDLSDPRVVAVVAVAPVGALFGEGAFAGVTAPAQIHRLEGDRVLREPWHTENVLTLMDDNASLVSHPQAHHFAFISPFPDGLAGTVGPAGRDPAGFDRRAFLTRIDERILSFFGDTLPAP